MSANNLDRQPEERLMTEIRELKRQISELRTLQVQGNTAVDDAVNTTVEAYVNLNASPVSQGVATGISNNAVALFRFRFTNSENNLVFSNFFFTLYQGSVHPDNIITGPGVPILYYDWYWWRGLAEADGSVNNRATDYVYVRNRTGATQTIICRAHYRYIVSPGTTTVS